jgi:glucose-6-phosphate isomerase
MNLSEVRYDYTNMLADAVGENGVSAAELDNVGKCVDGIFESLSAARRDGVLGFVDLPYDETAAGMAMKTAASFEGEFDNLVVIGSSALTDGVSALAEALLCPRHNLLDAKERGGRPRLFVLDDAAPDSVAGVLDLIDINRTLLSVAADSGEADAPDAAFPVLYDRLRAAAGDEADSRVVATTSPRAGDLRKQAKEKGWKTLPIPSNVGGRLSVLSTVGLFPAAMLGVDVRQLLSGAAFMDRRVESRDIKTNPALAFAALTHCLSRRGVATQTLVPRVDSLGGLVRWCGGLWDESRAAASAQCADAPAGAPVTFIEVEQSTRGTKDAVVEECVGRPSGTVTMSEVSAFTLGQIICLFETAAAFEGALREMDGC